MVSGLELVIDGTRPVTAGSVEAVEGLCDRAEDHAGPGLVVLRLSGAPAETGPARTDVGLVSKWERALRRMERLGRPTVAVASGDVGGPALEALLATDVRIATPDVRLLFPAWPGMALYRLTHQTGLAGVRRAVLFGAPIDVAGAVALRLVDEVAADPAAVLAELAGSVRPEPAIARQLMFDASSTSFEEALGAHLAACERRLRREAS